MNQSDDRDVECVKDISDPKEAFSPLKRKLFSLKNGPDDYNSALFIGPTQGGKSFQAKKMLIDVFDTPKGQLPFDVVYFIGQQKHFQIMRSGFAAMEFAATGRKKDFEMKSKFYTVSQVNMACSDIMSESKDLKKFAFFDDCFSINSTNKIRDQIISIVQQGQHLRLSTWITCHMPTDKQGVSLRKCCNVFVVCNENSAVVASTLCNISPDSEPMKQYEASGRLNEKKKKMLIYDQSEGGVFYDYKYLQI